MFLEENFDSDEDNGVQNTQQDTKQNLTNDPFNQNSKHHLLNQQKNNGNTNLHNYKDLNDIKNSNNNNINNLNYQNPNTNTSNYHQKEKDTSGIIDLETNMNDTNTINNNYSQNYNQNENQYESQNQNTQSRRVNRKQTNNNHSKIQERYEQRTKQLYQDGQSQKQEKFQASSSNYYDGINFNNVLDGQAQYEPGQLKGIDNDLPTLTQQNKQFQIQEEKQRSHLRLSDDSDHDLSDKESKKQKDNQQSENLIQNQDQDSNAQIQFSDDSEEEDDSEVITKQMQDLKLEHQNDKEEEDAAQVQVAQEEQKETPELVKKNEEEEEEEEEEDSKNKKIIAKPIDDFDIPDMKEFLTNPLPKGLLLQCTIKRDKSKMSHFYPKYHVYLSKKFQHIMSGKKRSGCKTSNYLISMDKNKIDKKSPGFIGKVRSNFMGTEFHVYDTGLNPKDTKVYEKVRRELACVLYESNILGAKGPRKMKAIVPDIDENTQQPIEWKPLNNNDSMLTKFKANNKNGMQYYFNKPPKWNEHIQAFVLNFNGRVDKASVKNFQLIDEYDEDTILLQFGRVGNDLFNMDLQWPLSPLQAFGICLSSFDYKIACE